MRIKTFQGRTLEEILPQIKAELGEDAVVLSTRQTVTGGVGGFFGKRAVEVTAADRMPTDDELVDLEQDFGQDEGVVVDDTAAREAVAAAIARGVDPAQRAGALNVTDDASINLHDLVGAGVAPHNTGSDGANAMMRQAASAYGRTTQQSAAPSFQAMQVPERMHASIDRERLAQAMLLSGAGTADLRAPISHEAAARAEQALREAESEIRSQQGTVTSFSAQVSDPVVDREIPLRAAAPQLGAAAAAHAQPVADHRPSRAMTPGPSQALLAELAEAARALQHFLCVTGVNADVAQAVVGTVIEHRRPFSPEGDLRVLARDVISETVRCSTGWPNVGRSHRAAFVGPSGAGKSTTVAKLAEGYMRGSGYRVGVISVVPELGIGAAAQGIGADPLIRRPNLDVRFVSTPDQMHAAIDQMAECDLVMVDTPSSAYLDSEAMRITAACLSVAKVDETHVVVPLATSVREAESVIRHFAPMHVNRLAVTKLDESRYAGQLLNFGFRFGLPITFLSDGPRIPEDVRAASAREIAELIVPQYTRSPAT